MKFGHSGVYTVSSDWLSAHGSLADNRLDAFGAAGGLAVQIVIEALQRLRIIP
jgi:hypothetical protein